MHERSASKLYGRGIFTTVALLNGQAFVWEKHWRRLTENAAKLGIDISEYDERSVIDSLAEAIARNEVTDGRARITFSDESPSEIWGGNGERKTTLSIITAYPREMPENFKLTVSPHRINTTSPLTGIKSCNYLEHLLAFEEARSRGFHEAIRQNERGEVASACMANVFWLNDEKMFTPSLNTGCLAGTTREYILENSDCDEVEVGFETVQAADVIFLTSAGIGVVQVTEFDGRKLRPADHVIRRLVPMNADLPA